MLTTLDAQLQNALALYDALASCHLAPDKLLGFPLQYRCISTPFWCRCPVVWPTPFAAPPFNAAPECSSPVVLSPFVLLMPLVPLTPLMPVGSGSGSFLPA